MRNWMLVGLLGLSGVAAAQTTHVAPSDRELLKAEADADKSQAQQQASADKLEADEAKMRAQLDEARKKLDEAARQVAELSMKLGARERGDVIFFRGDDGPSHGVLGLQIDSVKEGARVIGVSPGGPAENAGLRKDDVIVALDGKSMSGDSAGRAVNEYMRTVKPDQKVKVRVLRAGKNQDFVVTARLMHFERQVFNFTSPGTAMISTGPMGGAMAGMPPMDGFGPFFAGEFGGMELARITPKLGAYFGTNEGVLVVQAPDNAAFKLEDGDVIQSIDGRKPDDGAHALRILRSYKSGEKLSVNVLRQRKAMTLAITMPERPEFENHFTAFPPVPPVPPEPPAPGVPGGTGTGE